MLLVCATLVAWYRFRWACSTWLFMLFIFSCENALPIFVGCVVSGFRFWSPGFYPTGGSFAINRVTWYVNESFPICLIPLYTYLLLYQGPPILFMFVHWKDRVRNQNEIHCYIVYKIIDNVSIITINSSY